MTTPLQPPLDGLPVIPPEAITTANPREIRIICALARRSRSREELDRIAGASNVPDAILALRRRGLEIPCERTPAQDKDGEIVQRGIYSLTPEDRARTAAIWGGAAA